VVAVGRPLSNASCNVDDESMNETTKTEWDQVGELLGSLGLKLKYHVEQAAGEDRTVINDAVHNLRDTIEGAFDALRSAVTDPAVRDDLKNVAGGVAQAITSTLGDMRDKVMPDRSDDESST
jgi:hypothetical protein